MRLRLFLLFACFYLLMGSRAEPWADSRIMYETTRAIVDRHTLALDTYGADIFFVVRDGKRYAINAPGNILALVPGYLLFKRLAKLPAAPVGLLNVLTCHIASALLMAGVVALFFGLCRREGASPRGALGLSLLLGLCTIVLVYARVPYAEALQTLCLLWLVERALALGDRLTLPGAALAGAAAGLLLLSKAVLVLAAAPAAAYVLYKQRRSGRLLRAALAAALPAAALLGASLAYNKARTGAWLDAGYGGAGHIFSGHPGEALRGLFLGSGCAFWLYSPPLLLGLAALPSYLRRDRARGLLLIATYLAVLLPLLGYHSWHGLWCWGPRYLVPLTPLLLLPAAPWLGAVLRGRWRRLGWSAVAAVAVVGATIQGLGASLHWDIFIRLAGYASGIEDKAVLFLPGYAPIRGHAWLLRHALAKDVSGANWLADAPWAPLPPKVPIAHLWATVRLDWWALDWIGAQGPKSWFQLIVGALLVGLLTALFGILRSVLVGTRTTEAR